MKREFFFVINPASAGGKTKKLWPHIKALAEKENTEFGFYLTSYRMEASRITSRAIKEGYKRIIAVGGDGTLNEVLNGFWDGNRKIAPDTCLGYFPSGTGEDFSRTLGIEKLSIETQTERLLKAPGTYIDIGEAHFQKGDGSTTSRKFINESSVGFGANVTELVNRSNKIFGGKTSFFTGVLRSLCFLKNHSVRIKADGKDFFEGKTLITAVTNGKYFGGSMMISPKAMIDDGFFDVVIAREMNRKEILRDIGSIYSGNHLSNPKVLSIRCKTLSVQSGEKVFLEMDGEPVGLIDAQFKLLEKEIRFLL
ncbi:MAG: diacylglycerol kinase family protein [Candidatus Margulisiibacteriota bacterium]